MQVKRVTFGYDTFLRYVQEESLTAGLRSFTNCNSAADQVLNTCQRSPCVNYSRWFEFALYLVYITTVLLSKYVPTRPLRKLS